VRPFSTANPETGPRGSGKALEHTLRVPPSHPGRTVDDDSRGFDYFATDLHHLSLAIEIRRRFAEKRGFLLLSGPPAPDGKLVQKYLDGLKNRGDRGALRHRATLVECKPEWTFGDVVIAGSRALDLGPDAGALSILSQLQREQRKGLMRVLVLDNGDALEDEGFDDLRRFARLDGPPDVLPVVLLVSSRFAERLESGLRGLKPAVVASLQMQHLLPGEVAAFIGYQIEPLGGRGGAAFAPETIAAIAEAAQGDPRMVNRLMRQDLGLLSRSRGPTLAVPERAAEPKEAAVAPAEAKALPQAETLTAPEMMPANDRSQRSRMARLARGLAASAALLVVGLYAGGFLYLMAPGAVPDDARRPVAPAMASASTDIPAPPAGAAIDSATPSTAAPTGAEAVVAMGSSAPSAPPPAAPEAAAPPVAAPEAAAPAPSPVDTTPAAAELPPSAVAPVAPDAPTQLAAVEAVASPPAQITPAAPAAAAPAALPRSSPASEAVPLLARADQLLASGDMASAREFFELAADAGSAAASYRLGQTYDPLFLRQAAVRGVAANPEKAVTWYRRAAAAGSSEAAARLAQLPGNTAGPAAVVR
jgi:hypothetical protein